MSSPNARDADLERLINLTFALLDAGRSGGRYLTPGWLRSHVAGYGGPEAADSEASRKRLQRDVRELRRVGVPIDQSPDGEGYRITRQRYELPEVVFTPEEATVLGLAGELGRASELGAFARSGWIKLAASGLDRNLRDNPGEVYAAVNDLTRVPDRVVMVALAGIAHGRRITFDYSPHPAATPTRRRMDPWGLVNVGDRLYLVGFDLDRDEPRCFRLLRLSDVTEEPEAIAHPAAEAPRYAGTETQDSGEALQQIVERTLARGRQIVDAQVRLAAGKAGELRARAGRVDPDGTAHLHDVDREWLVRTACGYGPDAVVLAPEEVRRDVVNLLRYPEAR